MCVVLFYSIPAHTQNFSEYNWLFGNHEQHVAFLKGNSEISILDTTGITLGLAGSAVATDPYSGELLFFTDGITIYDASYQPMLGGTGLNGDTLGTKQVVIAPIRYQDDNYYVIYRTPSGVLEYSVVNMTNDGNGSPGYPLGEVISSNQSLINSPVGTFTTVQGGEDGPYYLVYQDSTGTNDLITTVLDPLSVPPAGASQTTSLPNGGFLAQHLSYNAARSTLVVSPSSPNVNVHLYNFNLSTGALNLDTAVVNSGFADSTASNVYDAELSQSGRMLYVSRHGTSTANGTVYQYDLDSGIAAVAIPNVTLANSFGLKLGPDGNIYHIGQIPNGRYKVYQISQADSVASMVGYTRMELGVQDWVAQQFPEISPTHPETFTLGFSVADLCTGGTTKFFPNIDPPALDYFWSFDSTGSNTSTAIAPVVEFPQAGDYSVTLIANIPGVGSQSVTQTITIVDNSMNTVTVGNDTTICPGETLTLEAVGNGIAGGYFWSEIDSTTNMPYTGTTLDVTDAGDYWVRVDYTNGCVGSASVNVQIYNEQEQRANFWDFGQNVEIDFNDLTAPVIQSNQIMDAPQGCATISDASGKKVLFSDGDLVYARNNTVMSPGTSIGGNTSSSQSTAIVPFQNTLDSDLFYYVFTTDEMDSGRFELAVSVVDLRGGDALGEVISQGTDVTLFTRATERLSQTFINGTPTIVTHEYGTNSFVAFQVTPDGIVGPIYMSGGSVHSRSNTESGEGYMEFNAAGDKLAVALKTTTTNMVEIFDVDGATQTLSNPLQIVLPDPVGTHSVYGVEFSPGGSKIFISVLASTGFSKIYEARVDSADQTFAQSSRRRISDNVLSTNQRFGAIQTAPNGQILVAVDGATSLGVINVAEDSSVSTFNMTGFSLATSDGSTVRSRLGLPNFAQATINPITPPTMNVTDGCLGNVLTFTGSATSQLDTLTWYFGDGNTQIGDTVQHQYALEGVYSVTLQISNRCGLDTLIVDTVNVYQAIPELTIPNSISLCTDPVVLDAANGIAQSHWMYTWSTGETSQSITVGSLTGTAQLFSVTVTDSVGCTNSDSTLVVDGRPQFDLGTDLTVCQDEPLPDLNASNTGALFTWAINGVNTGNTTRLQSVNTATADTLVYSLTVNDTISGCSDTDTVTYIVNPTPVFTTNTTGTSACGVQDGLAEVIVTSPTNFSVSWTGPNNFTSSSASTGTILESGFYTVVVTDNLNGCTDTQAASVTDGGNDFNIVDVIPADSCVLSSAQLFVDAGIPDGTDVDVYIQNQTDGSFRAITERVILSNFTIRELEPGDYLVQIEDPSGCIKDTTFSVSQLPQVSVSSPTFIDACGGTTEVSIDVSGVANPEILWTAFNGGGFPVTQDITLATVTVDAAGLYLVTVSDESSGLCPATDSVQVNLNDYPGVSIQTDGDNCEGQITLSLTTDPTGNYTSIWTQNGTQVGVGNSYVATSSGRYDVYSTLQSTGCEATDFIAVTVNNPLEVIATGAPACDDGNPILLTAIASGVDSDSLLYTWRGPGQISGTFNTNTINIYEAGTYTVSVRRNRVPTDGCTASDQITINLIPFDSVSATPIGVVCPPDPEFNTATLEAQGNFIRYDWYALSDSSYAGLGASFVTGEPGAYMVVATDAFGCIDTAFSQVNLFCEVFVRAPTAFRPGSPVGNGTYRVVFDNLEVGSFEAYIYNRWGELVRTFNDPGFEWDGTTASGQPAPPGTYAVVFRYRNVYTEVDNEEYVERTMVTLLR